MPRPDLGLYLHVPFCRVRCGYCSFAISTKEERTDDYLDAVERETACRAGDLAGRFVVETIYFGGGTPSRLDDRQIERLLRLFRDRFEIAPRAEVTLEANPEDLPPGRPAALRALGIDRLSVGVQATDDDELRQLDRSHDAARARAALSDAVAVPGLRVSADLMLGTPGQSAASFLSAVDALLATGLGHLSIYVLETDRPSRISRETRAGRLAVPPDDLVADLFLEAERRCAAAGIVRYETSNFARPGEESRHNLRYWRRRPVLGLGPSAVSMVDEERFANAAGLPDWLRRVGESGSGEVSREAIPPRERLREEAMLGLREARGMPEERLEMIAATLGRPEFLERLREGVEAGDLARTGGGLAFTGAGFLRSNLYLSELF